MTPNTDTARPVHRIASKWPVLLRARLFVRCNSRMTWWGKAKWPVYVLGAVVVVGGFVLLYTQLPWWIDGVRLRRLSASSQLSALSADRGDVLKMVAGAGALVALIYTARKHTLDRQAHALSEQSQVTDRFTKAIGQLASDKLEERLGGIYALERIMVDSERDHMTIMAVLGAFVREHAKRGATPTQGTHTDKRRPTTDVQAAISILARRPERDESFRLDLRNTDLAGVELSRRARLKRTIFTGADLSGANLAGVDLSESTFVGATLAEAQLREAILNGARFGGTDLTDASLHGARLLASNLVAVRGLKPAQLASAVLNEETKFNPRFAKDPWVLARVQDCLNGTTDPTPEPTAAAEGNAPTTGVPAAAASSEVTAS